MSLLLSLAEKKVENPGQLSMNNLIDVMLKSSKTIMFIHIKIIVVNFFIM